ncbi:MAG: hypothetical protein LBV54_03250, partial [Puniceicoccales bacterium]|nr:hypothetical protein [Puniceicoccales bacterium]
MKSSRFPTRSFFRSARPLVRFLTGAATLATAGIGSFLAPAPEAAGAYPSSTMTWTGSTDDWFLTSNWSSNAVPGNGSVVSFAAAGSKNVTINSNTALARVRVEAGAGLYTVTVGNGVTWNIGNDGGYGLMAMDDLTIDGPGAVTLYAGSDNAISTGKTVTINAKLLVNGDLELWNEVGNTGGTLILNNSANSISTVSLDSPTGMTIAFTVTGALGQSSQTGAINVKNNNGHVLRHDGSEEAIVYHSLTNNSVTLQQNGSGRQEWR